MEGNLVSALATGHVSSEQGSPGCEQRLPRPKVTPTPSELCSHRPRHRPPGAGLAAKAGRRPGSYLGLGGVVYTLDFFFFVLC